MAKKNSDYWRGRFIYLEDASNSYGVEAFRQIEPAFDKAERQIQGAIEAWYSRFATNNEITMQEARKLLTSSELKEFRWDVKEYIKYGRENGMNAMWMKELENASAKVHISRLEALKLRTQQAAEVAFGNELDTVDSMVRKVYTEGYYHSAFELQKGFNIGWEIGQVDERKLETLVTKPWAADGKNFSERIWEQRTQLVNEVHSQLTRTCITGKAPDDAIKAISKKFGVSKNQAGRLVMTEQAYFHSVAQKEAFDDLDVEEFEIVATLDSKTSEICQEMDGQHFPMKEYEPGVTAPPFHPWCRSVTVPYFDDEFSVGERAARDENGETYYVPSDMKYKDWKKSMVDGKTQDLTKTLTNVSSNDTIGLNRSIQRKDANFGVFSNLEVPMQKRKVKEVARKYGLDVSGLTIKIQRSEKLLSLPITGSTDYENIGRIDLFPNAFIDEEQLVRTLVHERCHVNQLKKYGRKYVQEHLDEMEKEAYALEEDWFVNLKKVKK